VKRIALSDPDRVGEIVSELRGGNIIVSDMGQLMDENPEELKESVDRLKGMIGEMDGQVARLSETMIIATPEFVRMQSRGED